MIWLLAMEDLPIILLGSVHEIPHCIPQNDHKCYDESRWSNYTNSECPEEWEISTANKTVVSDGVDVVKLSLFQRSMSSGSTPDIFGEWNHGRNFSIKTHEAAVFLLELPLLWKHPAGLFLRHQRSGEDGCYPLVSRTLCSMAQLKWLSFPGKHGGCP